MESCRLNFGNKQVYKKICLQVYGIIFPSLVHQHKFNDNQGFTLQTNKPSSCIIKAN